MARPQVSIDFWRRYDALEAQLTAPLSERMLELAALRPGMRVLDVASGRGEPALRAAHRVGPSGLVLGIDRNDQVLEMARAQARAQGLANLELRVAEAETFEPGPLPFDVATCRWAVMFFDSPERALERIRGALVPGGVFVAALWAEPERVPWASVPREVLARYGIEMPSPSSDGPGVFRFADPDRIRQAWSAAGFRIDQIEELDVPVIEAPDAEGIVTWSLALGGEARQKQIAALPERAQQALREELAREAERHRVGERIRLGGITRVVVARK